MIRALGQGGMARVYAVADDVSGRELALKQLSLPAAQEKRDAVAALFEAEFHTLAQLSHPRVIEVYDYGLSEAGPFYTMELLDGGDLYDRSPLPWREACALIYDVCSSLALLHSRRFVHRDITPRNIRCTRDGRAKLIDFGTMVPIGHSGVVAGTPAFIAPEALHRSALDGRADLFSLGATLYHALTRRVAFPARNFGDLAEVWKRRPRPPSRVDPQIPAALDALVLSLLSTDAAMRPRNAFEVMQRLSAIAGLDREEALVSQAYLSTPTLVAREGVLADIASRIEQAKARAGSACLLRAESGLGRTRMLDACVLEAKAQGAIVLRATAGAGSAERFVLAQSLAEQLLEAPGQIALESARRERLIDTLFEAVPDVAASPAVPDGQERPQLKRFSGVAGGESAVLDALVRWLLRVSERRLLVIAIDDLERCDEASASLLAGVAAQLEQHCLFMALTIEAGAPEHAPDAIALLVRYCGELGLQALTRAQTEELLSSLFGAVPNVGVLTEAIHEIARGSPGKCLDVAQHLVDRGALRYAAGGWTLPAQIDPEVLPRSAEDAMQERIAKLDVLARWLAEAHALSLFDGLSRDDYAALRPDAPHQDIDRALMQLVGQQVLVRDGLSYAFARRSWGALLGAQLDDRARVEGHRALARLYESSTPVAAVHHLLGSGQHEPAVARLLAFVESVGHDAPALLARSSPMRPVDLVATFERAHQAALDLNRPARDRMVLRGWLVGLSLMADDSYYYRFVDGWRAQLEHDSGLSIYRGLTEIADPGERLMRALQLVSERYASTPEHTRVYPAEEAIRLLVLYVGISIAIGSRCYDRSLLVALPGMLEPFAVLAPVIDAVRLNALASLDVSCDCRFEQGRARWKDVYAKLLEIDPAQLPAISVFRSAIAYAIGLVEARLGLDSADDWAELLDRDPSQRVNALYLRKVTCLHHGDFEAAERWRKQAEVMALQTPVRQMFTNVVVAELWAHAAAGDLVGVKESLERIVPLSERHPGWVAVRLLAEAQFQAIRGDLEAARALFERCLELCSPNPDDPARATIAWPSCVGSYVDTLQRLEQYEQARKVAHNALELCDKLGIGVSSHEIARGLALADARLRDYASAWSRLERVIAEQAELKVTGLQLGASYEACTRIAIWSGDIVRLQRYAALTAIEYRHGRGSALGARYERLMEDARHAGLQTLPELTDFVSTAIAVTRAQTRDPAATSLLETMITVTDRGQRARHALHALCKASGARRGYLYLRVDHGIALVASEGSGEPPDGLPEYLERYMRAEDEQSESATMIATEADTDFSVGASSFCDANGVRHQPLVLIAKVDGSARQIGIASFVDGEGQQPVQAELSAFVAACLIDTGAVVSALGR